MSRHTLLPQAELRRALRTWIPLALVSLLLATPALAQRRPAAPGKDVFPFPTHERTLQNGLRVIVVPTGFPNLVSLQIPVQTGSRNEVEPGKTGFAHFFEHMMFRGTKRYPADRYQAVITRIGARQNAYTSDDLTNYHVTFAKEDLEEVLELEADRFQNLEYAIEDFKTEARAVLGEYNKNSSDPLNKLDEAQREAAYTRHPYRHTTMGFLADIQDMPNQFEYSRLFFSRWYRPERTTLIVAGDVAPDQVFALVTRHWGRWKRGSGRPVEIPTEPPPRAPVSTHVAWPTATLPWISVAFRGPAFSETDRSYAAMDTLLSLTFGETSDVYKQLVLVDQTVDTIYIDSGGNVDPSLVTVYARVKKPADALRVRDTLLAAMARARLHPIDAQRLEDQKAHNRYAFVRRLDSTDSAAAMLARFAHFRRSADTLNQLYRRYDELTPGDLLAAARRHFVDEGLVIATLSHEPLDPAVGKPVALASLEPRPAPAGDLAFVEVPTKLPLLDVTFLFEAGSARDPKGKEGLAALAADMLTDAGSKAMRLEEIQRALHPLAATFTARVDKEMVALRGRVHRDAWERYLDIVLPQLLEPGFREDDFARVKDARRAALVQDLRSDNDEELGKERLQANVFAGSAYGHPVHGTVAGLEAITLDDVRAFVGQHYTRSNLVIGLGGDIPPALKERLGRDLARLPRGQRLQPPAIAARRPRGLEVEIIEKDTTGTAISLGHPIDVRRGHPDFLALNVARAWLGEHRSSMAHLFQRIREVRGLNYGDYAYIEAFPGGMYQFFPPPHVGRRAQLFEIWIRPVVPRNAHMALRIALHELRRLIAEGMTPAQFEATRAYLAKNVFVMTARQDQQVGAALDARWYGTPEHTRYVREGLARLTVDDVNRAIRKHLSGTDLSVVIVAKDARGLAAALVADGFSPVTYDAEKPRALLEEDRLIGGLKLGVRREAVRVTPVESVFAR
jgi:zinc protease